MGVWAKSIGEKENMRLSMSWICGFESSAFRMGRYCEVDVSSIVDGEALAVGGGG